MSYNNIGEVHRNKAEYDKALENYQKSLAIKLKQLGPDHPSVATSYHNIAFVYKAKKDLPKAKEYWEKAHAIFLKKLGPNHPNTKLVKGQLDALTKELEKK
jgi:tetratricopeptide (TPR) repeat protein